MFAGLSRTCVTGPWAAAPTPPLLRRRDCSFPSSRPHSDRPPSYTRHHSSPRLHHHTPPSHHHSLDSACVSPPAALVVPASLSQPYGRKSKPFDGHHVVGQVSAFSIPHWPIPLSLPLSVHASPNAIDRPRPLLNGKTAYLLVFLFVFFIREKNRPLLSGRNRILSRFRCMWRFAPRLCPPGTCPPIGSYLWSKCEFAMQCILDIDLRLLLDLELHY